MPLNRPHMGVSVIVSAIALMDSAGFVRAEAVSPEILNVLLHEQPDHEADYSWNVKGQTFQVHYAQHGSSALLAQDATPSGTRPIDYVLKDSQGKMFHVVPGKRQYSYFTNTEAFAGPLLQSLAARAQEIGARPIGEMGSDREIAGHRTQSYVIRFEPDEEQRKLTVFGAIDLRLLVIEGRYTRGRDKIEYTLSNIALDPPDSLFVIPSGFERVEESVLANEPAPDPAGGLPGASSSEYFVTKSASFQLNLSGPPFTAAHALVLDPRRDLPSGSLIEASFELPGQDSLAMRQIHSGGRGSVSLVSPFRSDWAAATYGVTVRLYADSTKRELLGIHVQRARMMVEIGKFKSVEALLRAMTGGGE